jgi:hypothetical protein
LSDVLQILTTSIIIALIVEAVNTSDTQVSFYQSTQRNVQKTVTFTLAAVRT